MKNSTSKKLNIFKTSPLIGVIAILEVIILICVSTFAWFVYAENNTLGTDIISVEPDSGLEIDFNEANENDYINIWNYLNEFQFEPITSLDGRNLFVPTTGTFNATETSKIKFREATVNDMNSKYINIDFTLTNTGEEDMPVYLSSKSFFKLYDPVTEKEVNSKAIRIAFYQNDGSSGKITSTLLSKDYDGDTPEDPDDPDGGGTGGSTYTVYLDPPSEWTDASQIKAYVFGTSGNPVGFPGEVMQYDSSTGYYYYTADRKYNKIIFNYHGNQNQTVDLDVYDQGVYVLDDGRNGTWALYHIQRVGGTKVEDDASSGSGSGSSGNTGESEGQTTVYFYNSLGWEQPYAYIWDENNYGVGDDGDDEKLSNWPGKPMTHISGAIYYYTFSSKYDSIIFNDGNDQGGAVKTGDIYPVEDGHIYMIGSPNQDNSYGWETEDYVGSVDGGTYPVISPGVSTGFQRPYAPVTEIDDNTGKSKVVIPAFASSIDDYNNGSGNPLFTIAAGQTLPLSMVIWLEGTDPDCTEDVYSGKFIDMNLVFATPDSQGEEMYTYKFLDKTKENWIDDVIVTETDVSFKPVIQLYDVENHKGYHMSVHDDENGNPTIWQCQAPVSLASSKHIMFRRVNPMNEDEVWNYWDTDGFGSIPDKITNNVVNDSVVTFTAFSDGAPTNAKYKDGTEYTGAPTKSCGGLWGDHNTQIITVYDATPEQWIKNSDEADTSSILTMKYTFNGQIVEYKASSAYDKGMHYFIMPIDVYSKTNGSRPPITFSRYYNFNAKYAANSDRNQLTYHMSWNAGVCNGKFAAITENSDGTDKRCYWGSDILYVQAKNIVKSKFDSSFNQVHFYASDNTSEDGTNDFYAFLYKNDAFKPGDGGYGYVCVVPSDRQYHYYRVERCNPNNHSEKWNISPPQPIQYQTTTNTAHSNTIDKNGCSVENLYLNIYLEVPNNMSNKDWCPEYYIWKDSTGANEKAWPGNSMTFVRNSSASGNTDMNLYKCYVNISQFDRILFSNEYNGQNHNFGGNNIIATDNDYNGMVYRAGGFYTNNNLTCTFQNDGRIGPNEIRNETLNLAHWDAVGWDYNGSDSN
ncbi:MAG: starch-binding protein [Eubacteriales bacterium]|nr:starch-binding protein [Eubacteriales bacterium]